MLEDLIQNTSLGQREGTVVQSLPQDSDHAPVTPVDGTNRSDLIGVDIHAVPYTLVAKVMYSRPWRPMAGPRPQRPIRCYSAHARFDLKCGTFSGRADGPSRFDS